MTAPPILAALRAGTAEAHAGLDADMDLDRRVADPARRREMVRGFHALHAAIETAAAPWLSTVEALEFDRRRRTPVLARDLADLGAGPMSPPPFPVADLSQAMGAFYVLEGSALGGRVIRKSLVRNGASLEGLSFFDFYGPDVGRWWSGFVAILDREHRAGRVRTETTVDAAIRAFGLARALLVEQAAR